MKLPVGIPDTKKSNSITWKLLEDFGYVLVFFLFQNKDKEGKESKSKSSSHRFVSVSFSNATTCDVCHKPLTNKPALRCQSK